LLHQPVQCCRFLRVDIGNLQQQQRTGNGSHGFGLPQTQPPVNVFFVEPESNEVADAPRCSKFGLDHHPGRFQPAGDSCSHVSFPCKHSNRPSKQNSQLIVTTIGFYAAKE
jgi:hypothetical protein